MMGPIVGGHLSDLTGTFRWSFGIGALAVLLSGLIIGLSRRPKELIKKEED